MNDRLDSFALWLADFQLLGAILLAVTLAAQAFVRQPAQRLALGKATLAALALLAVLCAVPGWSVVHLATREALPVRTAGPVEPRVEGPAVPVAIVPPPEIAVQASEPAPPTLPPEAPSARRIFSWVEIYVAVYAAGSLAVGAWLVAGAFAARRLLRGAQPAPAHLAQRLAAIVAADGTPPRLLVSDRVPTAVALGVLNPTVLLPRAWATDRPAAALATVLAHEWTHIRNGDLRWLAASRGLLLLLWCQPLYWLLRRRMGIDQEALADAAAADVTSRQRYAEQLVAWARSVPHPPRLALPAAVGLWEGPSQLRRRIALLLDERLTVVRRCSRLWTWAVAVTMTALAALLSVTTIEAEEPLGERASERATSTTHHSTVLGSAQFDAFVVGNPPHPWAYKPNVLAVEVQDEAEKPVAGLNVEVYRVAERSGTRELAARGTTNEQGTVEFASLVAEDLAQGYVELATKSRIPQRLGEMFYVVLRQSGMATVILPAWDFEVAAHGIRRKVRMRPAAELSGRVTNQAGELVAGATVAAGGLAGRFALQGANAVNSDADGRFRFTDVVTFDRQAANKKESATANTWMAFDHDDAKRYPPVYDPADATSISDLVVSHPDYAVTTVRGGDVPGTTDVVMAPAAAIEGRVVDFATGEPVAGVAVRAAGAPHTPKATDEPVKDRGFTMTIAALHTASTLTDADGRYRLANLPAGKYDVWPDVATDAANQPSKVGRGITQVQARAADEPTVVDDIVIGPGGTIRGQLIDANTDKPLTLEDGASLRATYFLVDGPGQQSSQSQSIPVTTDGSFELQTIPGRLRIFLMVHQPGENSHPHGDYRSDDATLQSGPVFDLAHGESIETEFPVWSRAEQDRLRKQWMRGYDLLREEKYDEAIAQFSQLLESRPDDTMARQGRGQSYEIAGKEAAAAADYEALLTANPADSNAKFRLGRILATSPDAGVRNGRRAIELLSDVLAETRRNPPNEQTLSITLSELAAAYAEAGNFDAAVATQREAIESSKSEQALDHLREVLQMYEAGQPYHRAPPEPTP